MNGSDYLKYQNITITKISSLTFIGKNLDLIIHDSHSLINFEFIERADR